MQREEWTLEEKVEVLERRVAVLERILRISQILTSTLQLEPLLQTIAQAATELTDTTDSSIMLVDKNTGELHFEAASGSKREEVKRVTVPLEGSIAGWIVREGKPLLIPDVRQDPRFYTQVDETMRHVLYWASLCRLKVKSSVCWKHSTRLAMGFSPRTTCRPCPL